jgi:hypothetical protein
MKVIIFDKQHHSLYQDIHNICKKGGDSFLLIRLYEGEKTITCYYFKNNMSYFEIRIRNGAGPLFCFYKRKNSKNSLNRTFLTYDCGVQSVEHLLLYPEDSFIRDVKDFSDFLLFNPPIFGPERFDYMMSYIANMGE